MSGLTMKGWLLGAGMLVVLALSGCKPPREVDTVPARRAAIIESFTEPSRTRLADKFVVAMPIAARVEHLTLQPGDAVAKGQPLGVVDVLPLQKEIDSARAQVAELEARARLLADEAVEGAEVSMARERLAALNARVGAAAATIAEAEADANWATAEHKRLEALRSERAVADREVADARRRAEMATAALTRSREEHARLQAERNEAALVPAAREATLQRRRLEREAAEQALAQARARLAALEHDFELARLASPIDGVVLERHERGGAHLPAGTRLFLLGALEGLEVEADALTQDAMKLRAGSRVEYRWAPDREPIAGKVKRVESSGFTKYSSLGVEQQRVRVISSLDQRPAELGVEYRLTARYVTGEKADALVVPRYSLLQRPDGSVNVFVLKNGRLELRPVRTGLRSDLEAEVLEGLKDGDVVVATPDATLTPGMAARAAAAH